MKGQIGECKLCLRNETLLDSHYLPKGIYRRLRDESFSNPNPWTITTVTVVQTSKQMSAYLLCRDCEDALNKNGERWVLANCQQRDGSFPLASVLDNHQPEIGDPDSQTKRYLAYNIPEVNIEALTYFAASVFWRGSIYAWNRDNSVPIKLGPYGERFRNYLLGLEEFPENCNLWVIIRKDGDLGPVTYAPVQEKIDGIRFCKFPMPGFAFMLFIGKKLEQNHREHCFVKGIGNPIFTSSVIEPILRDETLRLFNKIPMHKRGNVDNS